MVSTASAGSLGPTLRPMAAARAAHNSVELSTWLRSQNQTGPSVARRAANSRATRVFPVPEEPVTVTT